MTIKQLAARGQSGREIARLLGVCESTVRYHLQRQHTGALDGRSQQQRLAARCAEAVTTYLKATDEDPVNLAAL